MLALPITRVSAEACCPCPTFLSYLVGPALAKLGVEIQVGGQWKESADRTPVGAISAFGGTVQPDGWLMCNGAAVPRGQYPDLYAVIGTNFGAGDGSTTFNLPNLAGICLTGVGTQNINGRAKAGPALGALREDQFQGHWHVFNAMSSNDLQNLGNAPTRMNNGAGTMSNIVIGAISDGTNGTPRVGAYTHGPEIGVNFIIKC